MRVALLRRGFENARRFCLIKLLDRTTQATSGLKKVASLRISRWPDAESPKLVLLRITARATVEGAWRLS